ncbi:DUF6282 family protein [Thermodesulfobacteriota bacterium]
MEGSNMPYIPKGYVGENLLEGCSDLHVHACPEIVPGPVDDVTTANLARDLGMKALVLKPFLWHTVRTAQLVESIVSGIKVYGSLLLNVNMGGLDPSLVDAAGRLGAKVVWMPTWSAENDLKRGGFSKRFKLYVPLLDRYPVQGLSAVTEKGSLRPEVVDIIRIAKQYDMILCTGHISVYESKCLAKEAQSCGFKKLVFSHPLSKTIAASLQDIKEMAEMGTYIELCAITAFPMHQHVKMDQMVKAIAAAGYEHTILTSDANLPYNPPGPVMMQMFLSSLIELGIGREDLDQMAKRNPAYLLGLEWE